MSGSSSGWNTSLRTDLSGGGGSLSSADYDFGGGVFGFLGDIWASYEKLRLATVKGKSLKRGAIYARWEAGLAREQGAYAAKLRMREAENLEGAQRVAYAKSNVRLEGTPMLVIADEMARAEEDAFMLRYQGQIAGRRYEQQAYEMERAAKEIYTATNRAQSMEIASSFMGLMGSSIGGGF